MNSRSVIWRFASNGAVEHGFWHRGDPQAICGREVRFILGTWHDGDGKRRQCRSCINNLTVLEGDTSV
jgi:hypothetical protein